MVVRRLAVLVAVLVLVPGTAEAAPPPLSACPMFPADNYWHADVSDLPVHELSDEWVQTIGAGRSLKADFGSGLWEGSRIGIPYNVVGAGQPRVRVQFDYADESDRQRYPIPARPQIEGGSDRHILIVDTDRCRLFELFNARRTRTGWRAGSGAVFDLDSNAMRPAGWTSADAAGLPMLPGLVRWREAAAGSIDHAIRFTVPQTRRQYVWPARHYASSLTGTQFPPMGAWFRLKADVDISGYTGAVRAVLEALQTHGMILSDNGSPWYLSGVPHRRWDNDALRALGDFTGSDFEAVDTSSLMASPDSGQVAP
jgi:hypothetical protein